MASTDDSPQIKITVGGQTHVIDLGKDFTAIDGKLFRERHGMGIWRGVLEIEEPDILATFVWLFQRKTNPHLEWDDVAGMITIKDVVDTMNNVVEERRQAAPGAAVIDVGGEDSEADDDPS